ncbi:uncharacterized protein LOC129410907 isoform X1 [Boleophthalmus pectinirostris]|uniref:uncharacterized protein LOC129410907 isoform X1 n=1 Tax=Boleophthalmus pectinirostris TaxID=150288 RepID=UPI00242A4DC5|nr:uncharacterized protein LOC129410907 isoform X1 [Boleophthalmus pectinirostris]
MFVFYRNVTTPTSAFTPPTPSLTPPTPSLTPPTPSLTPPTPSLTPPTPSLTPPSITVIKSRAKVFEEDDRRVNKEPCYSLWSQRFFVDKEELKQRIVQLLLREDERSREQDSEEHLQKKKKDLISLFRDIEESGENWHNLYLTDNTPYNCTAIIISFCFRYKLL